MAWTDRIDIADEQFHPRSDDFYWSENSLQGFNVPERDLSGIVYFYWRPNMNLVVAGPAIWGHTGEDVYNCLYYGWDQHLAIPEGAEMFDFELSNSLSCQMIEPQREYRFGYDRNGVTFDLTWTAMAEPHYMKLAKSGEEDPGIKNWVKKRATSPSGTTSSPAGSPACWRSRARRSRSTAAGCATAAGGRGTPTCPTRCAPGGPTCSLPRTRPGTSTTRRPSWLSTRTPSRAPPRPSPPAFYIRDGVKAQVVGGTRRAERGRDGRVLTQVIDTTDELGRELHAVGTSLNWLKWPINSDILNWWPLVRWEYDGQVVYGNDQDFMSFKHYRRYWRKLIDQDPGLLRCFPDTPDFPPSAR